MIEPMDLKQLLKKHRWTLNARRSGNQQVFSAKQRRGPKLATLYIATEHTLRDLTEADIVALITRKAAEDEERLAQKRGSNSQAHCPTHDMVGSSIIAETGGNPLHVG